MELLLDNIFISPKYHSVLLLGGWWNSVNENEKLFALNSQTVNICPNEILNSKISSSKIDLESIKLIGRELLDDKDGFKIINDSKIPKAFSQWLMFSNNLNVIDTYEYWQTKVLINSFGVRHFTKMDVSYSDLYL